MISRNAWESMNERRERVKKRRIYIPGHVLQSGKTVRCRCLSRCRDLSGVGLRGSLTLFIGIGRDIWKVTGVCLSQHLRIWSLPSPHDHLMTYAACLGGCRVQPLSEHNQYIVHRCATLVHTTERLAWKRRTRWERWLYSG
jgi:hypothetical protein